MKYHRRTFDAVCFTLACSAGVDSTKWELRLSRFMPSKNKIQVAIALDASQQKPSNIRFQMIFTNKFDWCHTNSSPRCPPSGEFERASDSKAYTLGHLPGGNVLEHVGNLGRSEPGCICFFWMVYWWEKSLARNLEATKRYPTVCSGWINTDYTTRSKIMTTQF